jgi:CelD/BcsL family acetyltransferase involved in cellulose biosynthesis
MGAGETRTTVARSEREVEALRDEWQRLDVPLVHADPDFFMTVVRARPEVERPHVVHVSSAAGGSALLVARKERIPLETRIGYRTLYRPTVSAITAVLGGVIAAEPGPALEALVESVESSLEAGEADVLVVPSQRVDTPAFEALASLGGTFRRQRFVEARTHRLLELPATFDDFLAARSKKARSGVRYDSKKLLEQFGSELRVETLREPGDFDRIFRDISAISRKTYQHALGAAFTDTDERRQIVRLSLERGWFRAWVLYRNDEPIAFWQGTVYGRTYHSGSTGYDPEYRSNRVGIYLLMRLIEDLCRDPDVDRLDYGLGDASYKRQFSTESWEERDLLIFAPRPRGLHVNLTRTAILASGDAARRTVDRLGLAETIKTRWRKRLASKQANADDD